MKIVRRILFLLLILALAALVLGQGKLSNLQTLGSVKDEVASSGLPADFPYLTSLSIINGEGYTYNEKYNKQFAFEINDSANPETIAADIIEIYSWGRSQYGDISSKCYTDPDSSCKVGKVAIFLLDPNRNNDKYDYNLIAAFYLDQDAIDQLLFKADKGEMTIQELDAFHKNLYQTDNIGVLQKSTPWLIDLPVNLP